MQSQKHLWTTCSVLLIAALLAACAAPAAAPTATPVSPTATPVPPTPTPVPPTAIPSLLDLAKTYESAWNSYEPDALAALFAESFTFNGSPIKDFTAWHRGWPYGMMMGSGGKIQVRDCEVSNDTVTCTIVYDSDCNDQEMIETWTVKDGKITELVWQVTPEEASKWDRYESLLTSWATAQNPAELSAYKAETAKGLYDFEWGGAFSALCHRYEEAAKVQAPATAAAAQGLVEALNSGDTNAALALFMESDNVSFNVFGAEAKGGEQMLAMFDWLASKESQFQITDCEWQGNGTQCTASLVDGCIAASGAPEGVNGKMTFYPQEDGTLRRVNVVMELAERKTYETWLEAETAWASANRANELAQIQGYTNATGEIAVQLCQEYAAAPKLDDDSIAGIDAILNDTMQASGVPGYAMCIVKDGDVVYSNGFGVTELGGDQPVTPQSVFSVRSTTKSFTGVALMQLVEQGKIDLDAPVTTYLPYFEMADPRYQDITVRMLASHMSGLVDDEIFQNMPPRPEEPAETGAAIEWFVRSLADDVLAADPGEIWQYAGTNFILLGDIIGKVSGEPYDGYIAKHLLEPLGMVHSTLDPAAIPSGALVGEHGTNAEGAVGAMPLSNFSGFEAPEAGVYSTCEDMTRWMQANLNRGELDGVRILQPESYNILWNVEAPTGLDEFFGPWSGQYGLGWTLAEDAGHFLAGHPGGAAGQNIGFELAPDDNLGVTVLANWGTEPDAYPAWMAAADVLYELLGMAQ